MTPPNKSRPQFFGPAVSAIRLNRATAFSVDGLLLLVSKYNVDSVVIKTTNYRKKAFSVSSLELFINKKPAVRHYVLSKIRFKFGKIMNEIILMR